MSTRLERDLERVTAAAAAFQLSLTDLRRAANKARNEGATLQEVADAASMRLRDLQGIVTR